MSKEFFLDSGENIWSEPVNRLSARIRVEFEDLDPGLRHAVYLELKNDSFDVVTIFNQPQIHAELYDLSGKPVNTWGSTGNGPMPISQWAMIPWNAYIGFRIDMQGAGVPTKEHGEILLATGGKNWLLKPGQYVLKIIAEFKNDNDGPSNQWTGELKLLPVKVVVTEKMITR